MTAGALLLAVALSVGHVQPDWRTTQSAHFEIHYLPGQIDDVDRAVRAAEAAYARVSDRLHFVLARRVPLVLFSRSGPLTDQQVATFAMSDAVAPQWPHRSRIVLPLADADMPVDARIVHELTHLLSYEIILPGRGGDGGLPRWVREGLASYMVGAWSDDETRLVRELAASGHVPALSQLAGDAGFTNPRLNDAIGHAAFDFIEARWGRDGIRRFWDALIVPRGERTYDAVFELTPAQFDTAFRDYAERRFKS